MAGHVPGCLVDGQLQSPDAEKDSALVREFCCCSPGSGLLSQIRLQVYGQDDEETQGCSWSGEIPGEC